MARLAPSRTDLRPPRAVSVAGRGALLPLELLALVAITLAFLVWAVWTLLVPTNPSPSYVNGTFGASSQADYKSSLDRQLAPQRSAGRG